MAECETLDRFISAQADVIDDALAELRAGQKRSHWMWFVFPQLRGLGVSPTAQHYGIADLAEAQAYLAHPVLGSRLIACTEAVLAIEGRTLLEIFGSPDDIKFRSSMTLFSVASADKQNRFRLAIDRYAGGHLDPRTLALLSA
jgi:uncharacterized protein (DUF1810 family)